MSSNKQNESINLKYLSKMTKRKFPLFNNRYNQYNIILYKNIYKYEKQKFLSRKKWIFLKIFFLFISIIFIKVFKYYNVVYYYFMYEIDIRNPRVSDYFLKRYR